MSQDDFQQPESFIKRPLSEQDMETKLTEIREKVGKKMNKWADRISVSMAFEPQVDRVEGEIWTDSKGHKWIKMDGTHRQYSTLQDARMPWWCPKCSVSMNHRFDRKFFYLRGWCYNCNIEWEGKLRLEGKWEEFEKRTMRENEKSYLRDKITEHKEYIRTFKVPQMHFGDGRWEKIAELSDFTMLFEELEKDCELCVRRLEVIAAEEKTEQEALNAAS